MKKVLSILVLAIVAVQFAFAGDVIGADAARPGRPKGSGTAPDGVVEENLRGAFCGSAGAVVPPVCPVEHPQADAAHPADDQPVGELSAGHGGHHDE